MTAWERAFRQLPLWRKVAPKTLARRADRGVSRRAPLGVAGQRRR